MNSVDQNQAIEIAKTVASDENWSWHEPVSAVRKRQGLFSKDYCWEISTNVESRGCNIRVVLDDESGKVLSKHFAPR